MDYIGTARSNYVSWIDTEGVREIISAFHMTLTQPRQADGKCAILSEGYQGWNEHGISDTHEEMTLCVHPDLTKYLPNGEVLIIQEVGYEGHRFMLAFATAYTNKGILCTVALDEIYRKAAKACRRRKIQDPIITRAEY